MKTFVSIVGQQTLAVLNPLMALLREQQRPDRIVLLGTSGDRGTTGNANRIKDYLLAWEAKEFSPLRAEDIVITVISNDTRADAQGHPSAREVLANELASSDHLWFNAGGGMAFQVGCCAPALDFDRCSILYPETSGVHVVSAAGRKLAGAVWTLADPREVLVLQGVAFNYRGGSVQNRLYTPQMADLLPEHRLANLAIGGVEFDLVWNSANVLQFVKFMPADRSRKKEGGNPLTTQVRNLIDLTETKKEFGDLFHRNVLVFTDDDFVMEQLRESRFKIEVLRPGGDLANKLGLAKFQKKTLALPGACSEPEVVSRGGAEGTGKILYTALGTNLLPSLIAVWSHRPEVVRFLYTPHELAKTRDTIEKEITCFPDCVRRIEFWPVSLVGDEILGMPEPEAPARTEVNISPGSKGQTCFLAMWAGRYGVPVYSIKGQTIAPLDKGGQQPVGAPNPLAFLRLSGNRIHDKGIDKTELKNSAAKMGSLILEFLRRCRTQEQPIGKFPNMESMSLPDGTLFRKQGQDKCEILFPDGRRADWSLSGGQWFENVVGHALVEAGADGINVRVRIAWSEENEKRAREVLKDVSFKNIFKQDIDVIARFGSHYVVVSCKAHDRKDVAKIAREAAFFRVKMGRFAMPMVAFLRMNGTPTREVKDVIAFGWETLCDPAALRECIDKYLSDKRTTRA